MKNEIAWEIWILVLSLALAAMGCDTLGSDEEKQEQAEQLTACRGAASDAEVQENILITEEYAKGVAADLALSWQPVLFALDFAFLWAQTLGAVPSSEPVGWTYEDGTYRYGSDAAAIEMTVFLSEDLEYGPAGTQLVENILEVDSYLVNAAFEVDTDAGTVTITFDEPGPLVELLGLGAAPTSPITLDELGQQQAVETLGTLALEVDYIAYGVTQSTLVDYHAVSPAKPMAELAADGPWPVEVVEVNAFREALDQTLSTITWDVTREGGVITGYTTFEVSGGYFPLGGRIEFDGLHLAVIADRELYCL